MPNEDKPRKPEDFPVNAEGKKIKKQDATSIARTSAPAVAKDVPPLPRWHPPSLLDRTSWLTQELLRFGRVVGIGRGRMRDRNNPNRQDTILGGMILGGFVVITVIAGLFTLASWR